MGKVIHKIYSESLFEYANENNLVDVFYEQAKDIIQVFSMSPELSMFLNNPKISAAEKKEVIKNIFENKIWVTGIEKLTQKLHIDISKITNSQNVEHKILDFIYLIIDKGRESYLVGIFDSFLEYVREYKKIGLCEITSATELTTSQKNKILQKLLQITDFNSFEFIYNVEPSLIAGIKIKIGDTVVDSSIKYKLERINKSLRGIEL